MTDAGTTEMTELIERETTNSEVLEKDQSELNAKEIEALKLQIKELLALISKENKIDGLSPTTIQQLSDAKSHNKISIILKSLRILILFVFVCVYFGYEYSLYIDQDYNQLSQSTIEQIDDIEIPYFYIYGGGQLSNMSVIDIVIESSNLNYTSYYIEYIVYDDNNEFLYNSSIQNWTAIDMLGIYGSEIFIVPPYGLRLPVGSSLSLLIESYVYNADGVDDDTDYDFSHELMQKYSNGQLFGIFWDVESIDDIENINLIQLKKKYSNSWERLRYTFVATINYHFIDLFEEINLILNTHKLYYTTSYIASIINEEYTDYWKLNNYTDYWWYWTKLNLYPNPSGGGVKTTLTIQQFKSFSDILANVGGIFSPVNSASFLLLTWMIFGIRISDKFHINGLAPYSPLPHALKQQIKIYLIQLGLINQ